MTEIDPPRGRRIRAVHHLPSRTRLRVAPGPLDEKEAALVAEALQKIPAVRTVTINRRAASVLVTHEALEPAQLEQSLETAILAAGKPPPTLTTSTLARALARLFQAINRDILAATDGRLDAATLTSLGFVGAGALEVALDGRIGPPPWFNLAWWGFRTFVSLEKDAIRDADEDQDKSD